MGVDSETSYTNFALLPSSSENNTSHEYISHEYRSSEYNRKLSLNVPPGTFMDDTDTLLEGDPKEDSKTRVILHKIYKHVLPKWSLFSMAVALGLAYIFTSLFHKKLNNETQIPLLRSIATGVFFFISGFKIDTQLIFKANRQWKLHTFIQVFCFIIFPIVTYTIVKLMSITGLDRGLLDGLIILACVPISMTSNVVVTVQANGNEAAALFNSAIGISIGTAVSPLFLYLFSQIDIFEQVPILIVLLQLLETIILPLAAGQIIRLLYIRRFKTENAIIGAIANMISAIMFTFIIFIIFTNVFSANISINVFSLASIFLLVVFIHFLMLGLVFLLTIPRFFGFSRADRIAALFCGTQKTLLIGLLLMNIVFREVPNVLAFVTIPLVMHHPVQMITNSILIPKLKEWKSRDPNALLNEYGPVLLEPL